MGITTSMLMIAAGAIMRFAVTAQGNGFNVHTTGMVLMVVGAISAVLSIAFWASWGGFGRHTTAIQASQASGGASSTIVRETEVQARP
jgi:hypothetical protein